jgi:hypothetical protein
MKRFVLFLPVVLTLAGCAQVFDGNLFNSVDSPPALSSSSLSSASVADIKAMMVDDSFYTQLKKDPTALAAAQTALSTDFTSVTAGSTTADKAKAVDAAQTYILVTAYGSDAGAVVQAAITEATNLVAGGSPATAIAALVDGKSASEISTLLTNFLDIASALDKMQVAATSGTAVDSNLFFAGSASEGDLAQIALVAAAVKAMVTDLSTTASSTGYVAADVTALAAGLAAGTVPTPAATTSMTALTTALGNSGTTTANPYAYLTAVTGMLPF